MNTRAVWILMVGIVTVGLISPLHAQEASVSADSELVKWSIITAGFALAIAAAFGTLAQGLGLSAAANGIARNPSAAPDIRFSLILGLVLIESLVIYSFLLAILLMGNLPTFEQILELAQAGQ